MHGDLVMDKHFNKLTPAEAERLALLLEEMGEVQHAIGKILRHGYESVNPDSPGPTNRDLLERELGDFSEAMAQMMFASDISEHSVNRWMFKRRDKVKRYMHHQPE